MLLVGAHLVTSGRLSLGTMLALAALATAFLEPLATLVATTLQLQLLGSYLGRLDDVFHTPTETAGRDLRPAPRLDGAVRAEQLTFRYSQHLRPAVDGVDLDIRPGQVVAIVGRSGSGKSTLGRLLLGLYPPASGRVLMDGIDLDTLDPRSVRSQVGVVTQDPYIFGLSIRDNLSLGDPSLPLERLQSAAELAGIAADIDAMPMGWDTPSSMRAPASRVGNGSVWPWPGPWRTDRESCCSTRPPAVWTRSPRPRFKPISPGSGAR